MRDEGALRHLGEELAQLEEQGLLRVPPGHPGGRHGRPIGDSLLVLCSNDYLGYASEPWPVEVVGRIALPGGAGASRLVSGDHVAHTRAEVELSRWVGMENALLFSSGYAANMGVVAALARRGDLIVSDALNHASIIDGCRLSGATVEVVRHCDLAEVERALASGGGSRRRLVVTESYFSMDGDIPDLRRLRSLCDVYDAALLVDEAHALGVFGPHGAGLCAEVGVRADVLFGTLGKALGLQGAFVAGSSTLRTYLWNKARSFVYSTGMSPALAEFIPRRVLRAAGDDAGRRQVHRASTQLREGLAALGTGVDVQGRGPIIPWVVRSSRLAVEISNRLREEGVLVQAIRPPTVPPGTARLRIAATARLSDEEVRRGLAAFVAVYDRSRAHCFT